MNAPPETDIVSGAWDCPALFGNAARSAEFNKSRKRLLRHIRMATDRYGMVMPGNPMPIDAADLDRLNNLVIETAAAEIMPRFRNLGDDEVDAKESATDLVTVADVSAERKIAAELNRRYPEALVI